VSGQSTGWVLRHGPAPKMLDREGKAYGVRARGLRAVLVTIADAANRDGEHAHPGIQAMIEGSLYSRRQVLALIADLEAEGWIEITEPGGGRGHATVYRVCVERVRSPHGSEDPNGAVGDAKGCDPETETVRSVESAPLLSNGNNGKDDEGDAFPAVVLEGGHLDAARSLCQIFGAQLVERGYTAQPTSRRWILDMEALLRIDGRTVEQIEVMLRWLHAGKHEVASFWRTNVRSPAKLREKWQVILEQFNRSKGTRGGAQSPPSTEVAQVLAQHRNGNGRDANHPTVSSALSVASTGMEEDLR
jgi:hypothetical protein